jgi:hypothetical protein
VSSILPGLREYSDGDLRLYGVLDDEVTPVISRARFEIVGRFR